jgi:hypothetical protein
LLDLTQFAALRRVGPVAICQRGRSPIGFGRSLRPDGTTAMNGEIRDD